MAALGLLLALLAVVAPAAVATPGAARAVPDAKAMVLKQSDLGAGFKAERAYYVSNARADKENTAVSLADYKRWGRLNGYEAHYLRAARSGILVVISRANVYKSAEGPRSALRVSFAEAAKPQGGVLFKEVRGAGRVGSESRVYTATVMPGDEGAILIAVLWRSGNASASLFATGWTGTFDAAAVVKLARRQQRRIEAALP